MYHGTSRVDDVITCKVIVKILNNKTMNNSALVAANQTKIYIWILANINIALMELDLVYDAAGTINSMLNMIHGLQPR